MPHRNAAYPHAGLGARRSAFRDRWGKHSSPALHLYCWAVGAATGASGVVRNSRLDCTKCSWAGSYLCSVMQSRVWCLCPECWVFVLFINMCLNSLGIVILHLCNANTLMMVDCLLAGWTCSCPHSVQQQSTSKLSVLKVTQKPKWEVLKWC